MPAADIIADFRKLLASVPTDPDARTTELLVQGLDLEEGELLRRCAIPHQFDLTIVAVLAPELSQDERRRCYDSFTQLPIVTPAVETLAMHDRSRKYLFQKWLEPEQQTEFAAISARLAEFFSKQEGAASVTQESFPRRRMFHLIGADQDRGIDEFENLCRESRRHLRLTDCQNLIKLAREYDPVLTPHNLIRVAYAEGKLAADLRDWERATALFESIDRDIVSPEYRIKALNRLGMLHADQRHHDVAIKCYKRARDLAASVGDPRVFRTLIDLGAVYRDKGDVSEAQALLAEGIASAKKAGSFYAAAVGYNSLGMLHRQLKDIPDAIRDYKQSLENLERVGEKFRQGQVLSELGAAYNEQRDWATAEKYLLESLEIERQAGDQHNQAIVQNNLTSVYRNSGRPKEALEAARQAMCLFQETRDYYRGAMATRNFAKLCRAGKDRPGCEQAFKDAIDLFRRCNEIALADETERELAALTRKVGLPWWAWLIIGLIGLALVFTILTFAGVVS